MEQATLIYALYLGIDLDKEKKLIAIAQQALQTLPKNWKVGFGDDDSEHPGVPYFYNTYTEESRWTHPKEAVYFDMVVKERAKSNVGEDETNSCMEIDATGRKLRLEEFEEHDEQQKFGLNGDDFVDDPKRAIPQETISAQATQQSDISSDSYSSILSRTKEASAMYSKGVSKDPRGDGFKENESFYTERDEIKYDMRSSRKNRGDTLILSSTDNGVDPRGTRYRMRDLVRKFHSGDLVQMNDLMVDLYSLSSLNVNLEREIEETRVKGT